MSTRLVLATTIFVALSAPAFADGVNGVLITQARALAGNVTPGDAAGFPVTLSLPGLYRFASNLDVPAGKHGIDVTVPDVTIDLNGYRLHGFGRPSTVGIHSTQVSITVRNGTIAGFTQEGIRAGGPYWIIEDLRIVVNVQGIYGYFSDRTIVRNNAIVNNNYGAYCGSSCLIEDNNISNNGLGGVGLHSGLVLNNSILNNGGYGIYNIGVANDVGSTGNVIYGNSPNFNSAGSFYKNWCGAIC